MKAEAQVCWRKLGQPHLLQGGVNRVSTQSHTHMHTTERGEREQKEGSLKGALISPVNARVVICELWKYS